MALRLTLWISGSSNAENPRSSRCDHSRMHRPGPVRPARPARWSAEARLIRPSLHRSMPRSGSKLTDRDSPVSMTVSTPSMVIEVSAMFVLRMILRRSLGRNA